MMHRSLATLACALIGVLTLSACSKPGGIQVTDVYGYAPVTPGGSAVAYLTLRNDSDTPVYIDSLRSPDFALVEMHDSVQRNQQVYMQAMRRPHIDVGGQLELRPGGKHLMMMSPNDDIVPGRKTTIVIQLSDGSKISAPLELHDRSAPPPDLPQ